ncbi:YciI family protein [Paenarthrobacter sp. PH39-S1]|uniref:YciI family protein n=1 Tax=Paenarthrobacter sp. PH39-S1 TaxID=3046204 RepID=UPI0024BAF158|nr:YciI family protein [Paenarthrobacter sp. PH39-S1]MDJ0355319.1 YciI family protein [Paenarthrobacter sp. PH39-S1]
MSKFIYLYKGPATPMDQFTPEQSAAQTEAWGAWMSRVGPALVDAGNPFADGAAVVDDGSTAAPSSDVTGYSIVEAESLEAAKNFTQDHPFLAEGNGRFRLEIFELIDMQM